MGNIIPEPKRFGLSSKNLEWAILGISLICVFLFAYTGYGKIVDHRRFYNGLTNVEIVSSFAGIISWIVPILEILISVLIIVPQSNKWGLYAFIGLMTVFTGYILCVLMWAKKLPCHCGGAIEKLSWGQHIWFNLVFIFIAITALRLIQLNTSFTN